MLNFLRRKKNETQKRGGGFLALDIGTDVVKALVCEAAGDIAHIRGVGKVPQKPGDMNSGAVLDIAGVIENCSQALEQACNEADMYPSDVVLGIAGELVKGITYRTVYTRKEPQTKIDLHELKQIIHKVQWKSFEETRTQLASETGCSEIDIKLVNAALVDVRIDGFSVKNPIGFQGKEIEIALFNAFAPLVHFGALQTIAAELNLNIMTITAEPYALAQVLDPSPDNPLSALFIDIGGGTTDIALVRNGCVEATKMFTLGGRTFTKRLASVLNISLSEAESIKQAYGKGGLEKQSERVVKEAMETDADVWLSGIIITLGEFGQEVLPHHIYMCGGGSHLPEIRQLMTTTEWYKDMPFKKTPIVEILTPKMVTNIKDHTRRLNDPQDITPLGLARLGVEYIDEEHLMTTLLRKVIRLMQM